MRAAGRQKGSKIKAYTHVTVNPNAPKSRYTFSMHSSEAGAKKAAEKYSPLIGDDLKVVKQAGRSPSTDMFEEKIEESLWDNIRKRRAAGKRKLKPGDKNYPKTLKVGEDVPSTNTSSIPNPATTSMGPRLKTTTMHDKRRKKDQFPVLLKRFRKYIEDHG
jgi:hypothetical protein